MTKILFFGGDRLRENAPLSTLAHYFFKKGIETIIITDNREEKSNQDFWRH